MMKPLYISFNGQVEKSPCVTVFNQSPSQLGETWRNTPAKHHNQPWSPLSVPLNTKKCHPALIKQPPLQRPRRIFGCSMAPTVTSCVSSSSYFVVLKNSLQQQLLRAVVTTLISLVTQYEKPTENASHRSPARRTCVMFIEFNCSQSSCGVRFLLPACPIHNCRLTVRSVSRGCQARVHGEQSHFFSSTADLSVASRQSGLCSFSPAAK